MKVTGEQYHAQGNSEFAVYIDSPIVKLGTIKTEKDGSFDSEISLPQNSEPGVRTIHIIAKTYSGEPVDFYQMIEMLPNGAYEIAS